MQSLQVLQKRINSVVNLKSIVRTMKAHASTNILQFQLAAQASMDYRKVLDMAIYVVLSDYENEIPEIMENNGGYTLHIVFGSDHGLAGRFNERIANYAVANVGSGDKNLVIAVGQQVYRRLESIYDIFNTMPVPQTNDGITSVVQKLLMDIEELRNKNRLNKILLHYCKPLGNKGYQEESEILFPVDLNKFASRTISWESKRLPVYSMDREKLISEIIRQYFFITLYRSFCYSLVSENTSRIESMTSAEKNIEERLEELNFFYRTQRQNGITEEINDVVSGFKAIKKSKEKK
ncbi:F0F1 ATP synthase subunit gamma [Alkalibacter mobilis]|uniref:F0F1 ATP synthase subunit gamma n=1 Tax=Alkalibacter mobilis TaxID=2787712 RepID=UPI00189E9D11|nr:FoF1 ATP synthase subunit gamma [Alkalibacter mobilis]MBF7096983.1 F0F1 ATP synthase subunit gamma [Alkalibacter mobilis]